MRFKCPKVYFYSDNGRIDLIYKVNDRTYVSPVKNVIKVMSKIGSSDPVLKGGKQSRRGRRSSRKSRSRKSRSSRKKSRRY